MDLDRRCRLHQRPRVFYHRRLWDPWWALAILRQARGAWALTREWALSIRLGKTVTWALTRETTVIIIIVTSNITSVAFKCTIPLDYYCSYNTCSSSLRKIWKSPNSTDGVGLWKRKAHNDTQIVVASTGSQLPIVSNTYHWKWLPRMMWEVSYPYCRVHESLTSGLSLPSCVTEWISKDQCYVASEYVKLSVTYFISACY